MIHAVGEMPSFSTGYRLVTRVLHTHIFLVMTKHSVRHVILQYFTNCEPHSHRMSTL